MINGVVNIYKERGYTSHDVVAKLRGILKQKKIGHTGTLDPEAEGVLPVCLGKGTKLCEYLTGHDKTYEAVLLLGKETDTQDLTGTVLRTSPVDVTEEEARSAILGFEGTYEQLPPMYSALKVNGKKLCDLAREGVEVERESRPVTIHEIRIMEMAMPRVRMEVTCSKGTYIRTLCADIGAALGCGGCMESLKRTRAGRFRVEESHTLAKVEELRDAGRLGEVILPVDEIFSEYPKVTLSGEKAKLGYNGNPFPAGETKIYKVRVYDEGGVFIGIYHYDEAQRVYRPEKIFYEK